MKLGPFLYGGPTALAEPPTAGAERGEGSWLEERAGPAAVGARTRLLLAGAGHKRHHHSGIASDGQPRRVQPRGLHGERLNALLCEDNGEAAGWSWTSDGEEEGNAKEAHGDDDCGGDDTFDLISGRRRRRARRQERGIPPPAVVSQGRW